MALLDAPRRPRHDRGLAIQHSHSIPSRGLPTEEIRSPPVAAKPMPRPCRHWRARTRRRAGLKPRCPLYREGRRAPPGFQFMERAFASREHLPAPSPSVLWDHTDTVARITTHRVVRTRWLGRRETPGVVARYAISPFVSFHHPCNAIREGKGDVQVLLHDDRPQPAFAQPRDRLGDKVDDGARASPSEGSSKTTNGLASKCAADRYYLLLAAQSSLPRCRLRLLSRGSSSYTSSSVRSTGRPFEARRASFRSR